MLDAESPGPIDSDPESRYVRRRRPCVVLVASLIAVLAGRAMAQSPAVCIGDCNGDGRVTVDELILGVDDALNGTPADDPCPAFDCNRGSVLVIINCFPIAVRNAMVGCAQTLCGNVVCPTGQGCCNPVLSICAPPGSFCVQ